jgi:hypothetical protein
MLKGKKSEYVLIEEKGERIIITQNDKSSEDFNLHLIECFLDINFNISGDIEIIVVLFDFYTIFYEMYLEGELEEGFSVSLDEIFSLESKNKRRKVKNVTVNSEDSFEKLKIIFKKFCQLVNIEANVLYNEQERYTEIFNKYQGLAMKMHLNRKMPVYLSELLLKGRAKYFYERSNKRSEIDYFLDYLEESIVDLLTLRDLLKQLLVSPLVVKYVNIKLSSESHDNLVKNCLELVA